MTVKNYFYLLLFVSLSVNGISQTNENSKADYQWIIGNKETKFHAILHFDSLELRIGTVPSFIAVNAANASICDSVGNLLFFSNGLQIVDKSFKIMAGGKRISPSSFLDQYLETGVPILQFAFAVPWPGSPSLFGLFHSDCFVVTKPNQYTTLMAYRSFLTTIDRIGNSGNGSVKEADAVILQDSLNPGNITACRHANGRDWWILNVGNHNNKHIISLFDPDGVRKHHEQFIGRPLKNPFGQTIFTPDGKKLVRATIEKFGKPSWVDIYDFDRCTGYLSNPRHIVIEDSLTVAACGAAVSANSRFLYASYRNYVFQYDLEATDVAASKDTVAIFDGFTEKVSNFPTTFFLAALAPDGKIYINTSNSTSYIHVIESPDLKGKACNLVQHKIYLPTFNGFTMPNFPNYRLGPLKGSPCDTLSVATKELNPAAFGLKMFPNPASDRIQIDITLPHYDPATKTEVVVVDVSGEIVQKYTMPDYAYLATADVSKLASGVYGVQLRQWNRVLAVEKLVVVR